MTEEEYKDEKEKSCCSVDFLFDFLYGVGVALLVLWLLSIIFTIYCWLSI